jgi:hypothetical protein
MTAANLKPLYASSASAHERSALDVSTEAETVQAAVAPISICGPAKPSHPASPNVPRLNSPAHVDRLKEPITSPLVSQNGLVIIVGRGQGKQLKSDRRRRTLRAGPLHRPTTKAIKYSLVTTS